MEGETPQTVNVRPEGDERNQTVTLRTFHRSWEQHAEYLYDQTNLSKRQSEVESLRQFGQSRANIAEALGVSPNTVDDHTSKLDRKIEKSSNEQFLVKTPRDADASPFAPELVSAVEVEFNGGLDVLRLFENQAAAEDVTGAPAYLVAFERTIRLPPGASSKSSVERWFHPDFEHIVVNGFTTRPFSHEYRADAMARLLAIASPTMAYEKLMDMRRSTQDQLTDEFADALDRDDVESRATDIAEAYGFDAQFVKHHLATHAYSNDALSGQ